jgi:formate C-acetyltransferase
MLVNLVAPLEMALRNGEHPILGKTSSPRTGTPQTWEAFFTAYCDQLAWVIDRAVEGNNQLGRAHQVLKPSPLLSALFDGPMEKGKDLTEGGALYNSSGAAMIGLTDVVDSLCAVKTLVFEQRRLTLAELVRALDTDFAGQEALHAQILKKVPKFGQEHELPQRIAADLQRFVFEHFQGREHYRGGKYVPGYWSMSNHVAFGLLSGAVPSGRLRGKPFTPGLTPSALARASLTEQIHTVAALSAEHMPNNIAFNVKVVPGADDTHARVVDRMAAYAGAYFELGGMQMQFNVTSTQTLRDAMAHPEKYGDLLVRISGYNAYFVELNRDIQLELVERAEHTLGDARA